jgi:glycosyltransferase involved in cell wall biosynthesis
MSEIPDLKGEIIVVDNNSSDKTAEVANSKGARVVFEPINQISKARNTGAKLAKGEYLIFIDADTQVSPELLGLVLKKLRYYNCGGGGSTLVFDSNRNQIFFGSFVPKFLVFDFDCFKISCGQFYFL